MENWHVQFQKWHKRKVNSQANTKMAQAIFLPGAWGKIPVFMGKNHPTPGAAMVFCMLKTTPLKPNFFRRETIC